MRQEIKQCGSCGEPIWWLKSDKTGKPAPIEVKPSDTGNIAVNLLSGEYHIVPAIFRAEQVVPLHLNHFATCPQAKVWHKQAK